MLVLDASAVAELLLGRPSAPAIEGHLTAHGFDLHGPHLLDVEILSVIRRVVASGHATRERGEQAIDDLLALPVERYAHDVLVRRAWQHRQNFSAYDATYLSLAEALAPAPVPILTADKRFARAVETHAAVPVILVNQLVHRGTLRLGGRPISLADIRTPVLSVLCERDDIVPEPAAGPLPDLLTGSRTEQLRLDAGHSSLMVGRTAARVTMPRIIDWLVRHSEDRVPRPEEAPA